jgi:hypothetical protein
LGGNLDKCELEKGEEKRRAYLEVCAALIELAHISVDLRCDFVVFDEAFDSVPVNPLVH